MAASYKGKATYYGVASTATGSTLGTIAIQSISFAPEANVIEVPEGSATVGLAIGNPAKTLNISGIFVGTGIANAKAQAALTPSIGDVVTIADADDSEVVGAHSGKYLVMEAEKTKVTNDIARVTLKLKQWDDNDVSATVGA